MLEQHPQRRLGWTLLQEIFQKSSQNGYEPGEHCMGGAYFMSKPCVAALYQHNLLSREEIVWSRLQEDHLFGLLIYAVGFRHGDFATGSTADGAEVARTTLYTTGITGRRKENHTLNPLFR